MSNPDAVRPTGETGATCPWCGSEMHPFPMSTSWMVRCVNPQCLACGPQGRESQQAALAAAARPLPDFPAGARNEVTPGLSELERLRAENESMRDFIARNCIDSDFPDPDRPAAAGLTEIPEVTLESDGEWISDWWKTGHKFTPPLGVLMDFMDAYRKRTASKIPGARLEEGRVRLTNAELEECIDVGVSEMFKEIAGIRALLRAALVHAESLLSSRATGAEVEMPNAQEMADIDAFASDKRFADPELDPVEAIIEATVQLINLRRHATMRREP